jgi:hypothetical protein
MAKKQIVIETYHNEKQLAKGRKQMAKRGYEFESMTTDSRTGCLRKIMGGFIFARPKVYHTVTYKLAEEKSAE